MNADRKEKVLQVVLNAQTQVEIAWATLPRIGQENSEFDEEKEFLDQIATQLDTFRKHWKARIGA